MRAAIGGRENHGARADAFGATQLDWQMAMQWNAASLDCVCTISTISSFGFAAIHVVTVSPSSSRCWNIVAENTFTPLNIADMTAP